MYLISNKFLRQYFKIEALMLFQVLIVIILFAWGTAFNPTNEGQEYWFQRMGALMTIFSVYIEILVFRYAQMWDNLGADKQEQLRKNVQAAMEVLDFPFQLTIGANHRGSVTLSKLLSHASLVTGTIIWAYGDLIYKSLLNF